MIKIYIANQSTNSIGGGWSFISNFIKGLNKNKDAERTGDLENCDIFLIPSASMIDRDTVKEAMKHGAKIVLRTDNALKNSRNRNTGMSRMKDYAKWSSLVVYQSSWCRDYLSGFLERKGVIIINGTDTSVFKDSGKKINKDADKQFLYIQFNTDETKRWHEAWYRYQMYFKSNRNCNLWLVGNFGSKEIEYNFDFFNGEPYKYWGVIDDPVQMATLMRSADMLYMPYYNDACSQTLVEACCCNLPVMQNNTGGNIDIMRCKDLSLERMTNEYVNEFKKIL